MNPNPITTAMISPHTRTRLATFLGRATLAFGVLFAIALVIYITLVVWLHHNVSSQAISITQAAGLPATVEHSFRGILSWLLALAAVPAFLRLVAESFNPFRSANTVLGRIALLILVFFLLGLLPHGLRLIRGVDSSGLPLTMSESDPLRAAWFAPDGTPVLFQSLEDDAVQRFWNRPGITPDTGVPSRPVNREVRKAWQRAMNEEAARAKAKEEAAREADEHARQIAASAQHERDLQLAARREAEALGQSQAREAAARAALGEAEARASAESARAAKLAEQQEQLRKQLSSAREQERKDVVAKAYEATKSDSNRSSRPESPWNTVTLSPGGFLTVRGAAGSHVEIRSDGRGVYHLPNGAPPVPFQGGAFSFFNPYQEFRLVCSQPGSFRISYRWVAR